MVKATFILSNELSHDYVDLTGPELNAILVGLFRVWLSAVGLFWGGMSSLM